jgi:hypothetical protein
MWTDWFIADETEAGAIASIAGSEEDEHDFEDWSHLAMKGIIESQLMALWGVLQGKPGEWLDVCDGVLHQEGEADENGIGEDGLTLVTRVAPAFVTTLAKLPDTPSAKVVKAWTADESMADWEAKDAIQALVELIEFARRAEGAGKPVLQLVVV